MLPWKTTVPFQNLHCVNNNVQCQDVHREFPRPNLWEIYKIYYILINIRHSDTTTCKIIFVVISIVNISSSGVTVNKMLFIRPALHWPR